MMTFINSNTIHEVLSCVIPLELNQTVREQEFGKEDYVMNWCINLLGFSLKLIVRTQNCPNRDTPPLERCYNLRSHYQG